LANPIAIAAKGKGYSVLFKRARAIGTRYGLGHAKMDRALQMLVDILQQFDCGATFPITASVLARHGLTIEKYQAQGIEFAIHGYTHVDYSRLAPEDHFAHLRRARELFAEAGIAAVGFRSPYLSRGAHLRCALEAAGFAYVSNHPIVWDVLDTKVFSETAQAAYEQAVEFYEPRHASEGLSIPQFHGRLVEIPVSLPDDEMLLDRLAGETQCLVETAWRGILSQTHQRGELFTIQLHPERTALCADALSSVLAEARSLIPSVWIARLDEIAAWWQARAEASVEITETGDGEFHLAVTGPSGTTVFVRAVETNVRTSPWVGGYQQVEGLTLTVRAPHRPFIGVSSAVSPKLASFLREQGYIVEANPESHHYDFYFKQSEFTVEQGRSLLAQIERADCPMVRLGRWPNGARSALAVTGDIDALTLWDYSMRFLGR
jgi:peptidoglycan/xylan/chitin deacetylase (PgdA/CDA1 family)